MDVTHKFLNAVAQSASSPSQPPSTLRISPSLFTIHAHNLLRKLLLMEDKILKNYNNYVNYFGRPKSGVQLLEMTNAKRTALEQEITVFAVSWTTEVNELKRNYAADFNFKKKSQSSEYYSAVISYLLERLQKFTNFTLSMKSERSKHNINPFKLHTDMTALKKWSISKHKVESADPPSSSKKNFVFRMLSSSVVNSQPIVATVPAATSLPADFATRYTSEIAPPSKLKEYEEFSLKHKASLMAESKQLSEKFSENLQTAMSIEKTVVGVFDMLNQFIGLLKDQEEAIVEVHESSKTATQHVKDTDEELLLTIERSRNYQLSTVMVVVVMAIFLLVLDAMTP